MQRKAYFHNKQAYNLYNERLKGDMHIHIEGMWLYTNEFRKLFNKALKFYKENGYATETFKAVTGVNILDNVDKYQEILEHKERQTDFDFDTFLQSLYMTKIILSSSEENAAKLFQLALIDLYSKYNDVHFSVTPTVASDFDYLDRKLWNKNVINVIVGILKKDKNKSMTVVIETKRPHFESEKMYRNNIDFFEQLVSVAKRCDRLNVSLGVCDDERKFSLLDSRMFVQFKKYVDLVAREQKVGKNVRLNCHMLEFVPDYRKVKGYYSNKLCINPQYELEKVLDIADKKGIKGIEFVHMRYLFDGAKTHVEERSFNDVLKMQKGLSYLERIIKRQDRIVVCYSSNAKIRHYSNRRQKDEGIFLLDYPEIVFELVRGRLDLVLGTDDPGSFDVKDITEELKTTLDHLSKRYKNGLTLYNKFYSSNDLVKLIKFMLIRNSWRKFSVNKKRWVPNTCGEVSSIVSLDYELTKKYYAYDLLSTQSDYIGHKVREELIKREDEIATASVCK